MRKASLIAQLARNLPAMRETWVQSQGWEDPLDKGKATHSLQYSGLDNSMGCPVKTEEYLFLSEKQVPGCGALACHP